MSWGGEGIVDGGEVRNWLGQKLCVVLRAGFTSKERLGKKQARRWVRELGDPFPRARALITAIMADWSPPDGL